MTAKELINHLKTLPPKAHICVKGYEGGVDYVSIIRKTKISKIKNKQWYYGDYEEQLDFDSKHFDEIVWVIQ